MRRSTAPGELQRDRGERLVAKGYQSVIRQQFRRASLNDRSQLRSVYFRVQETGYSLVGIIRTVCSADEPYVVRFLDDSGPV